MPKSETDYLHRLGTDQNLLLEYGAPLGEVQYELASQYFPDDIDADSEEIERIACEKVEELKRQGRPGAFIVRRSANDKTRPGEDVLDLWAPKL